MSTTTYVSSSLSATGKGTCNPSTNPPQLPESLPTGFDSQVAYVLGLCCNSANEQCTAYVNGTDKARDPDFSKIISQGYKPNPPHLNLSVYEKDVNGKSIEIPAGFIVRLDPTDTSKSSMIVVAFHGTQNKFELDKDNDIVPVPFGGILPNWNLGSVHGGFYAQYTDGSDHQGDLVARADGSLAQQIYKYFSDNGDATLPVKVTGHSLGGALATLCALDIAYNFKSKFKSISMYSLASPRVADALADKNDRGNAATFVSHYQQYVPDSYRVVNTVDPVPTLPCALTPPLLTTNVCAHVLGDSDAILFGIVKPSSLDQNVVSFTDANPQNPSKGDSPQNCQGPHSCPAVYLPFLERLALAYGS